MTSYKPPPLTRAKKKFLDAVVLIRAESSTEQNAVFMARQLVQATLPHKNPGDIPTWTRRNRNLVLTVQPGFDGERGKSYGCPYGTIGGTPFLRAGLRKAKPSPVRTD